jgi:signal peptidase I
MKVCGLAFAVVALSLAGCGGSGSSAVRVAGGASTVAAARQGGVSGGNGIGSSTNATDGAVASTTASTAAGNIASSDGSRPSVSTGVPYEVHTTSMEPNYRFGSTVYYDPASTHPRIGDVVIFYLPVGGRHGSCGTVMEGQKACAIAKPGLTKTLQIKRVVGLPGDTIAIRAGRVIRNGRPEPEPRTIHCGPEPGCDFPTPIVVPAGAYYVMSDNRGLSQEDSRVWGAVPQAAIAGTVEGG